VKAIDWETATTMSTLYLLTAPPPAFEGTDAVQQDVVALRQAFGGKTLNLSPLKTSTRRFPKQLFGLHKIKEVRALEGQCHINHIFFPTPYPFPILRLLHNPVFYTVTGSLDARKKPGGRSQLKKLRRIVVSNDRDAGILESWGLTNYAIIPPGIDASALIPNKLSLDRELVLLVASAPWIAHQFDQKGIDLLLAAAAKLPFLRLILLWRGVLAEELAMRVQRLGLEKRVEIVNRKVNISDYLAKAHATVLLAKNGGIVKSFPHSLIESLVSGKPVILSNTIAMADYVSSYGCGVVIPDFNLDAFVSGTERLMTSYQGLSDSAARIGPTAFSLTTMIENHRRLYEM
jgi:glycosyltransferase involved in cell wall biosynthesis